MVVYDQFLNKRWASFGWKRLDARPLAVMPVCGFKARCDAFFGHRGDFPGLTGSFLPRIWPKHRLAETINSAMTAVMQLTRRLSERPGVPENLGIRLRHFAGPEDIPVWLSIREGAFARQKVGVRHWDEQDFRTEFLEKPWWNPRSMWFAELSDAAAGLAIGTISLAWRGAPPAAKPAIHWLAVLRGYRRRGIGRLLLSALEADCWDQGHRQIWLETHTGWSEALSFYRALGYHSTTEP